MWTKSNSQAQQSHLFMNLDGHQSRLLRLPREIRYASKIRMITLETDRRCSDHIYGYVLVYDKVSLEAGVTKAPRSRIAVGGEIGFSYSLYQMHELRYPLCYRSTWEIPLSDLEIPEPEFELDSTKVCMTYQLVPPQNRKARNKINLSLFLACKQVYFEASEVFYGKNTFSFTSDYRILTATAFFRDRPVAVLRYFRSLELHLIEVEERPPGLEAKHVGVHVLQFDYGSFSELCNLLSSPTMNLRHLCLSFETRWAEDLINMFSLSDLFEHDRSQVSTAEECVAAASWVKPLLNIKTLDHLSVFWINARHFRMVGKIAEMMGRHMFEARQLPTEDGVTPMERAVEILHQFNRGENEPVHGAVALYDPMNHKTKHWLCGIYDSGQKLNRAAPGAQKDLRLNISHPIMFEYLQHNPDYLLSSYFEWPQDR